VLGTESSSDKSFARNAVVLLGTLAVLAYWPILLGRAPFPADVVLQFPPWESVRPADFRPAPHAEMGDLATELYPWKDFARRSMMAGTFPRWNPHLLLGTPFVGDPQQQLFYPPTLLYALPMPVAWSLSVLFRIVAAGLLAALLARALGAEGPAALVSGVIFAFCGWVTAFQPRPHLDSALWLPLMLLAVDRLRKKATAPSIVLAAAAFALSVLGGQPECAVQVTYVGLAFFAWRFAAPAEPGAPRRMRFAIVFAAAGLLAVLIAAVQILPTLDFVGVLDRGWTRVWPPKPLHEIAAFVSRDLGTSPNSAGVPIPEGAAYAGMLTLLLAPLALLHRNRRDAVFFLALLAAVLSIVYGFDPVRRLALEVPVLRGLPNGRLLVVADLALAVLAGLGVSAVGRRLRTGQSLRAGWLLAAPVFAGAAAAIAVELLRASAAPPAHSASALRALRDPASSAAVFLGAALLLGFGLARRMRADRFATLALAFCVADVVTASYRFIPFVRPAEIFPASPTFQFLAANAGPYRVAPVDGASGSGFELMYGLDSAGGFNVAPRRTMRLLSPFGFRIVAPIFTSESIVVPASTGRLLDLLNVKYLVATTWNQGAERLSSRPDRFRLVFSDGSVRVFENRNVLPRAFLVPLSEADVVPQEDAQFERVTASAFDPVRKVILGEAPAASLVSGNAPAPSAPGVDAITERVNETSLRAAVAEPSILVLSQTHYPRWRVFVDGAERPLLRVDYGLTGVLLEPGSHDVRFRYGPGFLLPGAAISVAGLAICAGVLLGRARTRSA
jgi:hypothetical protein